MSDRLVYLAPDLPGIPEDLMLARDQGKVLFLTGAGVSTPAPSSLPDFRGLVVDIYARLDGVLADAMRAFSDASRTAAGAAIDWRPFARPLTPGQATELKVFARGEYDVVLGMLEQRIAGGMRTTAQEVLDAAHVPNTLHRSLNILARRFGDPLLVTTNFDELHERAAGRTRPRAFDLGGLPRPSRQADFHGVIHLHGRLGSNIALTDQDLGDLYLRRRIASDFIYDAIRIFRLVIIGYSLNDAPFRYLLNAVAGDTRHFGDLKDRYAFIPRTGDDPTLALEWAARSITPISYDNADGHRALQRLLAAWADSVPTDEDLWARRRLRAMCRSAHDEASEADRSVFGYVLRRSGRDHRAALVSYIGGELRASPDWLTAANAVVRELEDGR